MESKELLNQMLNVVDLWLIKLEAKLYEAKLGNDEDNELYTSFTLLQLGLMCLIGKEEVDEKTNVLPITFGIN